VSKASTKDRLEQAIPASWVATVCDTLKLERMPDSPGGGLIDREADTTKDAPYVFPELNAELGFVPALVEI
jgi:hypothetical protein